MHLLGFLFIVITIVLVLVAEFAPLKTNRFSARRMKSVEEMHDQIELSVEEGAQLMVGVGSGNLIDETAVSTINAQITAKHILNTTSFNDVPPVISSGDGATFLMNQDLIKNHSTYQTRQLNQMNHLDGVDAMSYAVGVSSTVRDEPISFCALEGDFGEELMLINDAILQEKGIESFVSTNNLIGQAVSVPSVENMMLGEEFFVINTYLGTPKKRILRLLVNDVLRWLAILLLILITLLNLLGVL